MSFVAPQPRDRKPSLGFGAGVMTVAWEDETFEIQDRGRVHMAQIITIETHREMLRRDDVTSALCGLIVRSQDGSLVRIAGVESFATTHLGTGSTGRIGLLIVPVEEL